MTVKVGGSAGSVNLVQKMMKGDDGGYYYPSIDENSNLSWTASEEDMPAPPEAVSIKGDKGDKGDIGVYIGEAEPTDDAIMIWLNTDAEVAEDLATKEYVQDAVASIEIPEPDLSAYALKTEIPDVSNFATKDELPDLSEYALKTEIPTVPADVSAFNNDAGYLTEHQDLSSYALKTEIPDVSAYQTAAQVQTLIDNSLSSIGVAEDGEY